MKTTLFIYLTLLTSGNSYYLLGTSNAGFLSNNSDCTTIVLSKNEAILTKLTEYTNKVQDYEIPYISQQRGDSTIYYLSAFVHSRLIQKNPPNAITLLNGKEVLVYKTDSKLSESC